MGSPQSFLFPVLRETLVPRFLPIPNWYRKRRYLHFDRPIGHRKACEIVSNPNVVALHGFYPMISYAVTASKISKNRFSGKLIETTKSRPIAYAAHIDAHIYSYYAQILSSKYESFVSDCDLGGSIFAFRSLGLSNIDIAKRAFSEIRCRPQCAAVALDVSGFFNNLDHRVLKKNWCQIIGTNRLPPDHHNVFRSITKFSKVDRASLFKLFSISKHNPRNGRRRVCEPNPFRSKVRGDGLITVNKKIYGIPQGTPISAVLSNIYMIDADIRISAFAKSLGGAYFRYCDDILVIVPITDMDRITDEVVDTLCDLRLKLNPAKTEKRVFTQVDGRLTADKPLQYLGFTFDGQTVLIRSAAFARFSDKVKRGVKLAKATARSRNAFRAKKGLPSKPLYLRSLYKKYSHLGSQNFLRYGYRAARELDSPAIRGQLKPLWNRLKRELD